ncbi:MAG: hypothetical protein GXP54_00380 [Deltaproteobacteria bacterium]|nr:hypothetical protein [Deltaproteobacteria bacterium]
MRYNTAWLWPAVVLFACGAGNGGADIADDTGKIDVQDLSGLPDDVDPDVPGSPDSLTDDHTDGGWCQEPPRLDFVLDTGDDGKPCTGGNICNVLLSNSGDRDLDVVLTQCGIPVWGAWITFEKMNDVLGLGQLEYGMAYTDADGVASRTLSLAQHTVGQFQVHVCEYGVPETGCIDFNVKTFVHSYPVPLIVGFADYQGAYPLIDVARVYLFKQYVGGKPKCDDLKVNNLPTATVISQTVGITQSAQFSVLPNLETEKTQNYTVVGLAQAGEGPVQAWGCEDGSTPGKPTKVEWGGQTYVDLELVDVDISEN